MKGRAQLVRSWTRLVVGERAWNPYAARLDSKGLALTTAGRPMVADV
jgi:hypothetical protein